MAFYTGFTVSEKYIESQIPSHVLHTLDLTEATSIHGQVPRRFFFCVSFMFFLSCVCYVFICALWSPAGKGLTCGV